MTARWVGCGLALTSNLLLGNWLSADEVNWAVDSGGSWNTPGNWSSNPSLPGANSNVTIDRAGGDYRITTGYSAITIANLVLREQLEVLSQPLRVSGTADIHNTLILDGGRIHGGTWTFDPNTIVVEQGWFDAVTLAGDLDLGDGNQSEHLTVLNGLTLAEATVRLGSVTTQAGGSLFFDFTKMVDPSAEVHQILSGTGEILLNHSASLQVGVPPSLNDQAKGILTIGSGVTIRGRKGSISTGENSARIIHEGLISAETAGGKIEVRGDGRFTNRGTLQVLEGATLALRGSWEGTDGRIRVQNGTLDLGGRFSQADLGDHERSGGTVKLTGILEGDLTLDASTGTWIMDDGTIERGTLRQRQGAQLQLQAPGTFIGVTAAEGDLLVGNRLFVGEGLTLNGNTLTVGSKDALLQSTAWGELRFFGRNPSGDSTQTLGGTGEIRFEYGYSHELLNAMQGGTAANTGTLVIGSGITLRSRARYGSINNEYATSVIVNEGTILVETNGSRLTLNNAGRFTNRGHIEVRDGGTLVMHGAWDGTGSFSVNNGKLILGGQFRQSDLGEFSRTDGEVELTGTLREGLTLNSSTGSWLLKGGSLSGGTLRQRDGAKLVGYRGALQQGVTLAEGDFQVFDPSEPGPGAVAAIDVRDGLTLDGGRLVLGSTGSEGWVHFYYNQSNPDLTETIAGTGEILLINGRLMPVNQSFGNEPTLLVQPGIVIRGAGTLGSLGGDARWITKGQVVGDAAGGTLVLDNSATWDNDGLLEARNGSTLRMTGGVLQNNGTIRASSGGLLRIDGSIGNYSGNALTGGTWHVGPASVMRLSGVNILTNRADIVLEGEGSYLYNASSGTADALAGLSSNEGSLTITDGRDLVTAGTLLNSGELMVGALSTLTIPVGSTLTIETNGTLGGKGVVAGSIVSAGTIAPGASVGLLTISGTLQQTEQGRLLFEIGGTTPGTGHDRLLANSAELDGVIEIRLVDGFVPQLGDAFQLIGAGALSGTPRFDATDALLPAGLEWDASKFLTDGSIHVVPEPMGLTWFAAVAGYLARRQRAVVQRHA